ncbi:hypothetical protein [Sulfuricaulis sp.]|jgi:hypothetical protein|uniref:hypothetical protein n=1 Tax=Sulfuricaulis sp. TaxID=2003553 RepID=UPI00355A33ED
MKRKSWLWWVTTVGAIATVSGYLGLLIVEQVYPESNLLGGWALILGPIFWTGLLLLIVAAVGGTISFVRSTRSGEGPKSDDGWGRK